MKSVIEVYSDVCRRNPPWSEKEEKDVIKRIYDKSDIGKFVNEAFKHNLGLVFKMMKRFAFNENNEDVFQRAVVALTEALKTYDPSRGTRISTWVSDPIKWSILKSHLSYSHVGSVMEEIQSINYRKHTKMRVIEIDKPIGGGDDSDIRNIADTISSDNTAIDYVIINGIKSYNDDVRERDIRNSIYDLINVHAKKLLNEKERFVVSKLASGMSQVEISREMNLSKMRVSQLAASSFKKIRASKVGKKLMEFLRP